MAEPAKQPVERKSLDERNRMTDLQRLRQKGPVWLFPRTTIELPEEIHRTLLLAYLSRGGDQSLRYSEFIGMLLTDAARRLEG